MQSNWQKAQQVLKKGGVIVAPTDTLYGILAKAEDKKAVERIYKIKGRDEGKPFIVLISSVNDLDKFGIKHSHILQNTRMLPKVSMIFPCNSKKFNYLHRGKKSIAFRLVGPRNRNLYKLIKNVGPLVAPSVNPQGLTPAKNIWEAKKYFGDKIDVYMCGGTRNSKPSTIVSFTGKKPEILRQGAVKIKF
jgi:L-threonylcarbamoyladenylate synthase